MSVCVCACVCVRVCVCGEREKSNSKSLILKDSSVRSPLGPIIQQPVLAILQTQISTTIDRVRHFSNRCDISRVAKVVHGNRSDYHCSTILCTTTTYCCVSYHPAPFPAPDNTHTHTHTLSLSLSLSLTHTHTHTHTHTNW